MADKDGVTFYKVNVELKAIMRVLAKTPEEALEMLSRAEFQMSGKPMCAVRAEFGFPSPVENHALQANNVKISHGLSSPGSPRSGRGKGVRDGRKA